MSMCKNIRVTYLGKRKEIAMYQVDPENVHLIVVGAVVVAILGTFASIGGGILLNHFSEWLASRKKK